METSMLYKTIILELLRQQPQMHERLRRQRKLMATMESYAKELKQSHEAWMDLLAQARPGSNQNQISGEALAMALKNIQDRLPSESPPSEHETLFLDAAMMFIRRPTSRG
jgi:hypothetical protein